MDSFLSITIICGISSISSSTSIQLFSEEGIIHRLGEGFYHHKNPMTAGNTLSDLKPVRQW